MVIIGFGHESRKGKDTACGFVAGHIRATRKKVSVAKTGFASKLKAICHDLYGWAGLREEEFYEDPSNAHLRDIRMPRLGKSPVDIWIDFGTHVGRAVYPDTWIEYPFYRYRESDFILLKDVRFANEVDAIVKRGGYVFKVENPNVPPRDSVADRALDGFTGWSGIIVNDGDLKLFHDRVIEACAGVL